MEVDLKNEEEQDYYSNYSCNGRSRCA